MKYTPTSAGFLICFVLLGASLAASYDGPLYDFTAYTECKELPEQPLYNGGMLKNHPPENFSSIAHFSTGFYTPAFILHNLTPGTIYCFSSKNPYVSMNFYLPMHVARCCNGSYFLYCITVWLKIEGANSAHVRASLKTENSVYNCVGSAAAKQGCWSFLKGGFVLDSPSNLSILFFQNSDDRDINIAVASASLQPFTDEQWRFNQQYIINTERKRAVTIHAADGSGDTLQGAEITIEQVSKDFPFGSAIASTILGNLPYQKWFVERFNAAVFENELKWYATEPEQGKINYTIADQMMEFVRSNQLIARGHNIFWEDPKYTPAWVRNLTGPALQSAVNSRIQSLMNKYKEEFIHWDVSNEMLHFDFYEQRLGHDATLHFYETAHQSDPLATLFMNEFNVVETCSDENSTVDRYISRLRELKRGGVLMDGIGLESHFTVPNLPLMRAILDKLATLNLPIWLTEVDISGKLDKETQAVYLEQVLREGFSHPSVNGIMLWTALHPNGCYQMCLTDNNLQNLPAGNIVDKLLKEWQTGEVTGHTDGHGSFSFYGFLDRPLYDFTAYTECKESPEKPLYDGGMLRKQSLKNPSWVAYSETSFYTPAFILHNLTQGTIYCFSIWVKIEGANSADIRASLETENELYDCVGSVTAKQGCWSFLKGGFVLDSSSNLSLLFFQNSDDRDINIAVASASLQPFTEHQWRFNQQYIINTERKRAVTMHVTNGHGDILQGAVIKIKQVSKDFPLGSAIASTILGNLPYQKWFVKRFNAAVFENELKWYATEAEQGKVNYTVADQMMEFVRANKLIVRGHNIFWENPKYNPTWVRNLTGFQLQSAVNSRIQSLMNKYKEEFIHWDVSNEILHFDFYEQRLGPKAALHFFQTAHQSDPLATLFMNEYNVVETCSDVNSMVDSYISRLRELRRSGVSTDGIGLQGHFTVPNLPLMRAIIDKMTTLKLPIWLTEVDISSKLSKEKQAVYLEQVLREGFSHPSVSGIMLWAALHPNGCYQMCLTDNNLQNLPAGDVVDKLLKECQTGEVTGHTDAHGSYSFYGFLG
ncbi:GH10 domain-containing protein [Citrus sinensis]|nr:GH10 domain-containing protein [Citrus sinensis]